MYCIKRTGFNTTQRCMILKGAKRRCPLLKGTELPEEFFSDSDFHTFFPSLIISLHKPCLLAENHCSENHYYCWKVLCYVL